MPASEMTGTNVNLTTGAIGRAEKRHAGNMIPMGVRIEMIELKRIGGRQAQAQRPQTGTPIENKQAVSAADFDARRVPAITLSFRAGTGYRAAHAPEA